MRRATLEGQHIGRKPLDLDRAAILRDRQSGQSLAQLAKGHRASRATIHRVLQEQAKIPPGSAVSKGLDISAA
jgi:DNA invertase Pin-like site-specific DNA recombinase